MKNATYKAVAFVIIITLLTCPLFTFAQAAKVKLEEGTQVRLKLMESISSATAQDGQVVSFEVLDEIRVSEQVVIAEGATAWGTIVDAEENKRMGRAGKLAIRMDYVKATDGSKIPLRANADKRGQGKGVSTGIAVAATAVVFWPAAPLFLLRKGKNAEIARGFHLQAFVDGDRWVETRAELSRNTAWGQVHGTKIQQEVTGSELNSPTRVSNRTNVQYASLKENQPVAERAMNAGELGTVNVISSQVGAEIEVDGTSYGNTPAVLKLPAGLHAVMVKAPGLPVWERNINVAPGSSLTFRVNFESQPNRLVKNEQ